MTKIKRGKSNGAKNSAMMDFFQSKIFYLKHRNDKWLIGKII